jgi:hypothetical protein
MPGYMILGLHASTSGIHASRADNQDAQIFHTSVNIPYKCEYSTIPTEKYLLRAAPPDCQAILS